MLTIHGVECAFSLSLENDRLPLILQVVHFENVFSDTALSPVHVQVSFLDECHHSSMILARRLSDLSSKLRIGDIVTLTNYISQCLDDNKVVIICLDITLMDHLVDIIGNPMDFVMVSEITKPIVFIVSSVTGFCGECEQNPCDWFLLGPTIVDCIRATKSIGAGGGCADIDKKCHFKSYQMYTHAKLGYLGKGNRVQLPSCVTNGIRSNFPDPNKSYIGFLPHCVE